MYLASSDELYLTIKGKGVHASVPESAVDRVSIASRISVALVRIVSRNASPKIPSVLTFGKVIANGATNVIPNEVKIEGTFRTLDEEWRSRAHDKMVKLAKGMAEAMGGSVDFEVRHGYPFLQNDPELTDRSYQAAEAYLGKENIVDLDIWMAAEDFAAYTQEIAGCFYRLGTGNKERGIVSGVHTPTFDIDEDALEIGSGLMAWLAVNELG